jgi:hypothetical protein
VATDSLVDRLQFLDLASDQVTFSRTGNNLVMTRVGVSTDRVTVTNWFSATANRLDFVNFTNVEKTAAQIDALVAGGGGSFPLSVQPPAAMRAAAEFEIGSDFAAWGAWNGGPIGETTGWDAEPEGKASSDPSMIWRPIKSFPGDAAGATTLGSKSAAEDSLAPIWQPIKLFARDEASVGVERLIDAMTTFGAQRNVDSGNRADGLQSDVLELLAAQHSSRAPQFRSVFHVDMN